MERAIVVWVSSKDYKFNYSSSTTIRHRDDFSLYSLTGIHCMVQLIPKHFNSNYFSSNCKRFFHRDGGLSEDSPSDRELNPN